MRKEFQNILSRKESEVRKNEEASYWGYHLLVGGSTGTVLAAVQKLASEFMPGDTIKRGFIVPGENAAWTHQNVAPMIEDLS